MNQNGVFFLQKRVVRELLKAFVQYKSEFPW